ncbi:MAG TPA: circadian clock KaiB family protein [Labilithrix sp.]|nr:circadian clock KaiB family protein [Labilithrix sp.]
MYKLRLYVAGAAPASTAAVETVRAVCDEHLRDGYELEVVDVYQQPLLALEAQIMTVPTLVRCSPSLTRRVVGPLSDKARVLLGLELNDKPPQAARRGRAKS